MNILYVLAAGKYQGAYNKDIANWASLRTVPAMKAYFNNMHTYHLSYAAYDLNNNGMKNTELSYSYDHTVFFQTGIKQGKTLYFHVSNLTQSRLF